MRGLFAVMAFAFWLVSSAPAAAQGCGDQNPNCIIPPTSLAQSFLQWPLNFPLQIGPLPFATADSYSAGAANASLLAVRGSFATAPITDAQAVAIFQAVRNNTSTSGSVPALYASTVKIGSGIGVINQAAQFEAVETAGNGGVAGSYNTGACTTASLGNCEGSVGIATATVAFSTLVGAEGNAINSSGTSATTTFSSSVFSTGFMATCGGVNACDAGVLTNPLNSTKAISGFLVTAASVSDTAFRNDASLVNGLDLTRGTYSGSAIKATGFTVSGAGVINSSGTGTGTPAASLCLDSSNNIIKKTSAGSCI